MTVIRRELAINDSNHPNHMDLGVFYLYRHEYDRALAEIERAVALAPYEAWTHALLAEVLSRMGKVEDALEAAAQALPCTPKSETAT